jgi:hypothetical protein
VNLAPVLTPGVAFDMDLTTILIDGHPFPFGRLIDPDGKPWGGATTRIGWSVVVPCPNDALVAVGYDTYPGAAGLWAATFYARWTRDLTWGDNGWQPADTVISGGTLHVNPPPFRRAVGTWDGCEPDWLAEHITRIATLPVVVHGVAGNLPATVTPWKDTP